MVDWNAKLEACFDTLHDLEAAVIETTVERDELVGMLAALENLYVMADHVLEMSRQARQDELAEEFAKEDRQDLDAWEAARERKFDEQKEGGP